MTTTRRASGRRATMLVLSLALMLGASACASAPAASESNGEKTEPLRLALDWTTYVPYHAPFALAEAEGIFAKHGITVTESLTGGSKDAALAVGTGKADIAWADLSTAAVSMLGGLPFTAIANVQDKNASGITVLEGTSFDSAKDVAGLKIGSTPGGSDSTLIGAFLNANGISENDVEVVNLPANGKFAALLTGKVDAISGQVYFYVSSAKAEGASAHGLSFSDMGLDMLDHGFIASDDAIASRGEDLTRFLGAYQEALARTIEDPSAACKILASKSDGAVETESCVDQLELWLPLTQDPSDPDWGVNDEQKWVNTVSVLVEHGGATGDRKATEMFTNELVPTS